MFDDTDVLGEIAGGFVVLRRDFIDAHPEAARTFAEQAARAADWARENPEEARVVLGRILEQRGENPDIAQYFRGFGVREGAQPVERDLGFWIEVLEREGKLPEGKLRGRGPAARRDEQTN